MLVGFQLLPTENTGSCQITSIPMALSIVFNFPRTAIQRFFLSKWIFFFFNCSTFPDVFDEFHFIRSLQGDVRIVKELPKELESVPRARKHFTSWGGVSYYEEMMDLWKNYQVHYLH